MKLTSSLKTYLWIALMLFAGSLKAVDFTSWMEDPNDPIYAPYPNAVMINKDDYFPSVIFSADQFDGNGAAVFYKMWHQGDTGIALSYSNDGENWTLQGIVVPDDNAFHASVIYDKGGFGGGSYHYKMWYWTGSPSFTPPGLAIKFTQSMDGVTWTTPADTAQDSTSFLADITQAGSFFYQFYGFGQVLYNPNATSDPSNPYTFSYVAFFDSSAAEQPPQTTEEAVGLAYSSDGLFWTRFGTEPVLIPSGNTADWDGLYAYRASVIILDGIYHMFYSGSNSNATLQYAHGIGHATSTDGLVWVKDPNNPIFSIDDPGETWRDGRTLAPWVVIGPACPGSSGSNFFQMWFSGGQNDNVAETFLTLAIGYATIPCPTIRPMPPSNFIGFLKKRDLQNIIRFGRLISSGIKIYTQGAFDKRHANHIPGRGKFLLTAKWNASPSPNVDLYRIYKDNRLVASIPASDPHSYKAFVKSRQEAKEYQISAVTSDNQESILVPIKIINKTEKHIKDEKHQNKTGKTHS